MDVVREGGEIKMDVLRGNTTLDMRQEQEDQVVLVILQNLSSWRYCRFSIELSDSPAVS